MAEIPDFIRRAIEAQGKVDPAWVEEAAETAIPSDESEQAFQSGDWRSQLADAPPIPPPSEPAHEQQELIGNVDHARVGDPETAHLAAIAMETAEGQTTVFRPSGTKHMALRCLAERDRTALDVERCSEHRGIWKRVSDLKNAGLADDTGRTETDPETGREGIVWHLNDRGRNVLAALDRGQQVTL